MAEFFQALVRSGVSEVCISPGSRSTPLAVAAHRTPGLHTRVILDERSAAFFALGLARQSQRAVALICTSGSAAANYLPAVVEAHHARVPLLILTADRPPELRDWGAGQTIDQVGLYGSTVRLFVDVPPPEEGRAPLRYAGALARRAVAEAQKGPAGPVHLNFPLREPLAPPNEEARLEPPSPGSSRMSAPVAAPLRSPDPLALEALLARIGTCERGVISCGPLSPGSAQQDAVVRLSRRLGWPILADPLSQQRRGPQVESASVLAHSDLWLRDEDVAAAFSPDLVLRFGDSPVSKALRKTFLKRPPAHWILIDPDGVFHDPDHIATDVLCADPLALCEAWLEQLGPASDPSSESGYAATWKRVDEAVAGALAEWSASSETLFEPHVVDVLARALPADSTLFVSNSMPIRDLDAFLPVDSRPLTLLGQRGASGIDGLVSGAAGASAAGEGPVLLLSGDLALLHDAGGFLTARDHALSLVVLVIQNDGGGIFSFLPIAEQGSRVDFERLFRTPHGIDLSRLAHLYDAGFTRVETQESLEAQLRQSMVEPGVHVIEVPVDRDANLEAFREAIALASAVARKALG
jgi:2-succinyl-5-enolpyruvyl-6-hydroxy-3-cyclohexene-1-carboxylate synthase